jgi:hypothetical protein
MLDIFIDISFLYSNEKSHDDTDNKANVKLNLDEENEIFILRSMEKYLALVFIIKEGNYDRPYLIE